MAESKEELKSLLMKVKEESKSRNHGQDNLALDDHEIIALLPLELVL